jgi:hypothetical protein
VSLAIAVAPVPAEEISSPDQRIFVIGEVQSAANTVAAFLDHLDLIDSEHHWSGGNTILIQTGDLIDRGENTRATLDLFMRLQKEAAAAGGRVIVLMGNHEAMNVLGEVRDVNYMAYQSFAGPDSENRQQQAWEEWVEWRSNRSKALGEVFEVDQDTEADWFATHPPGWVEYVESMRPEGVYGAWLRSLPVVFEIDEALFIHAGLSPQYKARDIESINRQAAEEIGKFDEYRQFMVSRELCLPTSSAREMVQIISAEAEYLNGLRSSLRTTTNRRVKDLLKVQDLNQLGSWSVLDDDGPLWFRGAARWPEDELGSKLASVLDAYEVKRMVTGQSDGKERLIRARLDDRVLLTSIDMSDDPYAGGGRPAALEIDGGDYYIVTLGGRELLIDN